MNDNVKDARKRVKVWINKIQKTSANNKMATAAIQAESLQRAADLEVIYQDFSWVDEMPAPAKKRLGRRVDPKSREQFAKWVRQEYDGWGSQQYLSRLHAAHEVVPILTPRGVGIEPANEGSLRPLVELLNKGHSEERVAALWQEAIDLAEGNAPTAGQTRKVVHDYLTAAQQTLSKNFAADPRTKDELAAARRRRFLREFDELMAQNNREAVAIAKEIQQHVLKHQETLKKEKQA